jgi:hypothetical protein
MKVIGSTKHFLILSYNSLLVTAKLEKRVELGGLLV